MVTSYRSTQLQQLAAELRTRSSLSEAARLKYLQLVAGMHDIDQHINRRAELHSRFSDPRYVVDGKVPVAVWSRDCDCVESTELYWVEANIPALFKFERKQFDDAEGPVSVNVVTLATAAHFQPSSRDRILEAFENGNRYSV